jgi:hypothetical protein
MASAIAYARQRVRLDLPGALSYNERRSAFAFLPATFMDKGATTELVLTGQSGDKHAYRQTLVLNDADVLDGTHRTRSTHAHVQVILISIGEQGTSFICSLQAA